MPTIQELKSRIDLHDLAERLGLERPGGTGNYRSPHHDDTNPSLSIYDDGRRWKDHSADRGGDCLDLVKFVTGCDTGEAVRRLHELYGWEQERPAERGAPRRRSREEYIADQCLAQAELAVEYLVEQRAIPEDVVRAAIKARAVGFNTWTSDRVPAGERQHGGPAVAFVVTTLNPGQIVAVDMRFVDPELNGGLKTQTHGEKGYPWFSSLRRLERADEVYIVESPINALSVEAALRGRAAALATRGLAVDALDLAFLRAKRVVICMDADSPLEQGPDAGRRPGPEAAWRLHELLTALNVSALMVDQLDWEEHGWNDVNDVLRQAGVDELAVQLRQLEPWAIPGLPGKMAPGRARIYLPRHDFSQYWRFRCKPDFTSWVKSREDEEGGEKLSYEDVCGFRLASLSRVTVASYTSTMTGDVDHQPRVLFAASVQVPRHGPVLQRRVFSDDELHNLDRWRKFGPIFKPAAFSRLLTILERSADLGARDATNFVGLAWRKGRPVVNEGPDCYFTDPEKQCPYHNLIFPQGTPEDAHAVIEAYQGTFAANAATLLLTWALGAHLKAFLGFWPHMTLQADKGAGKSTLVKRLERTVAFTMFSGESLQTAFRLLTSISHTSHPVGWEEISARKQDIIDQAVTKLQESYQYTVSRRSSDMTEYLISAPVLLAGEDVPVRSLLGKTVRTELSGRKGPLMPEDLPKFPVRQWLEFLSRMTRPQVQAVYGEARTRCEELSRATSADEGARRMAGNYAAVAAAWQLLCAFAELSPQQGEFVGDLVEGMNAHIKETSSDREPWVWIMETILSELAAGRYQHPHQWDSIYDGAHECLIIRSSHMIDHIARETGLREKWNMLPIKSDRVFRRQLLQSGVVVDGNVERSIKGRRESYMLAIGLRELARFGMHASAPEEPPPYGD